MERAYIVQYWSQDCRNRHPTYRFKAVDDAQAVSMVAVHIGVLDLQGSCHLPMYLFRGQIGEEHRVPEMHYALRKASRPFVNPQAFEKVDNPKSLCLCCD